MKKQAIFALTLFVLSVASCKGKSSQEITADTTNSSIVASSQESEEISTKYEYKLDDFSIISPANAPAATLMNLVGSKEAPNTSIEVTAPALVKSAIQTGSKDFVFFDSTTGLKVGAANYKLVRMVTYGNLFLVSTGNDDNDTVDIDDNIFAYGENLVPGSVFKKLYPNQEDKSYAKEWGADVASTLPILTSGLYEGEKVDYIVSSYPVIYNAMQENPSLKIVENLSESFSTKFHTNGFPQAGLFINKAIEDDSTKVEAINALLDIIDSNIADLVDDKANKTASYMHQYSSEISVQQADFGFNENILKGCQENNSLAFIKENPSIEELSSFNEILNIQISSSSLSKYYR